MCFKAAIGQIEICRTNISILTNYHVVDPTDGVRGVIPSMQGYQAWVHWIQVLLGTQNRYTFGTQIKKIPALTFCFKSIIIKYTIPTAGAI